MSLRCVVRKGETSGKLLQNPDTDLILSIKDSAVKRAELGEFDLKPLAEYLTGLSETELKLVRYHSWCRKGSFI